MKGYMYILHCANGLYYTGSTKNLHRRIAQHQRGEGANFTRNRLPIQLLYYEVYHRIDWAFYREKQIQGWSRKKKEALMRGEYGDLHILAACQNETHFHYRAFRQYPSHRAFRLRSTHGAADAAETTGEIKPIRVQKGVRTNESAIAIITMEELLEQLTASAESR